MIAANWLALPLTLAVLGMVAFALIAIVCSPREKRAAMAERLYTKALPWRYRRRQARQQLKPDRHRRRQLPERRTGNDRM